MVINEQSLRPTLSNKKKLSTESVFIFNFKSQTIVTICHK